MTNVVEVLSEEEKEIKAELELSIEQGLSSLEQLARDLVEYRDLRLWREDYESWEECVQDKWNIKKTRIQQILTGAATAEVVNELDIPEEYKDPSEGQIRPISKKKISDEDKKAVYLAAVEECEAEGKALTGAVVEKKAGELLPAKKNTNVKNGEVGLVGSSIPVLRSAVESLDALVGSGLLEGRKWSLDGFVDYVLVAAFQLENVADELERWGDE